MASLTSRPCWPQVCPYVHYLVFKATQMMCVLIPIDNTFVCHVLVYTVPRSNSRALAANLMADSGFNKVACSSGSGMSAHLSIALLFIGSSLDLFCATDLWQAIKLLAPNKVPSSQRLERLTVLGRHLLHAAVSVEVGGGDAKDGLPCPCLSMHTPPYHAHSYWQFPGVCSQTVHNSCVGVVARCIREWGVEGLHELPGDALVRGSRTLY